MLEIVIIGRHAVMIGCDVYMLGRHAVMIGSSRIYDRSARSYDRFVSIYDRSARRYDRFNPYDRSSQNQLKKVAPKYPQGNSITLLNYNFHFTLA